jgi:hypothetical protein
MGLKTLSIVELENSGDRGSVWVLNSAPSSEIAEIYSQELRGDIIIPIPKMQGSGMDHFIVHQTWLPIDASEQFSKERLLRSSEFRNAVRKGLITIISDESARTILSKEGAQKEKARLVAQARHVYQAGASRKISESNVDIYVPDSNGRKPVDDDEDTPIKSRNLEASQIAELARGGIEEDDDGLLPSFKIFAERLTEENDLEALNAIRSRGSFKRKELRYLKDVLSDKPKTYAALKKRIAQFKKK